MRGDDDDAHSHRCPQEVDHLLVGQRGHGYLADFDQPAPLAEACLPGVTIGLHLGRTKLGSVRRRCEVKGENISIQWTSASLVSKLFLMYTYLHAKLT